MMLKLLLVGLIAGLVAASAHATEIKGRARVIDGDTLWLGDIKIRLEISK